MAQLLSLPGPSSAGYQLVESAVPCTLYLHVEQPARENWRYEFLGFIQARQFNIPPCEDGLTAESGLCEEAPAFDFETVTPPAWPE